MAGARALPQPPRNFGDCVTFVERGQDARTDGSLSRTRKHTIPKEGGIGGGVGGKPNFTAFREE